MTPELFVRRPEAALAYVVNAKIYADQCEANALALDEPIAALRRGETLPPATMAAMLEAERRLYRFSAGLALHFETMFAEAVRAESAPPVEAPPRRGWWRRVREAWRVLRGA